MDKEIVISKIKLGYDDNLGLPDDFCEIIDCELFAYHDLDEMINAFTQKIVSAIFVPAGTLTSINEYEIIAQASINNTLTLHSIFVSTNIMTIEEINKSLIGCVNQYCTTSFWGPLIYFKKHFPKNTLFTFQTTTGFTDMLYKTLSNEINGSMVWDIILQRHPDVTNRVNSLFSKTDLPTPVMISSETFPSDVKENITRFKSHDRKSFFNGFQSADMHAINRFIQSMKDVKEYFNIKMKK